MVRDRTEDYLNANPTVRADLEGIRQPSVDFRTRCNLPQRASSRADLATWSNPDELVYRMLQRLPIRMLSLRTSRIVAALSVVVLVLTLGVWVWVGVTNDQYSQLDRRLDSVSSLGDFSTLLSAPPAAGTPTPDGNVVRTVRAGGMEMPVPSDILLPKLADGYANTSINGVEYRVRTFSVGAASIASARHWPKPKGG